MSSNIDVPAMVASDRTAVALLGPALIGWVIQILIAGICISIFYSYVRDGHFARESTSVKRLITTVFGLNCLIAFCSGESIFVWGTSQARSEVSLHRFKPLGCLQPALSGAVGFGTQGWFARRSALLFENRSCKLFFLATVGVIMLTSFAGAIGASYFDFVSISPTNSKSICTVWKITNALFLWGSAFVDSINTSVLCFLLATKVAHFNQRTDSLLKKIMVLSIETALYTTVAAIVAAVVVLTYINPTSSTTVAVSWAFWVPLPSLYTLSLLTTLVSRERHNEDSRKHPVVGELEFIHTGNHTTRVVPIQSFH